jgi:hypothetical protein
VAGCDGRLPMLAPPAPAPNPLGDDIAPRVIHGARLLDGVIEVRYRTPGPG